MTRPARAFPAARRGLAAVAVAAAVLPMAACSGSSTAAHSSSSASTALSGPTVQDAADGVSLTLPAGWVNIPVGDGASAALQKALPGVHTDALLGEIQRGTVQGLKAFALRPGKSANPVKLDLAVTGATGVTLQTLQGMLELNLTRLHADGLQLARLGTPAGEALRLSYTLENGATAVRQYYVLAHQRSYAVTVTGPASAVRTDVADAIARSLRLA